MKRLLYILISLMSVSINAQITAPTFYGAYRPTTPTGGGGCSDADANAFIAELAAQGYTVSPTQATALCAWYTDLKTAGVYTKIRAAGVTKWADANANKVNMITLTPYVTFSGSPTHGSTGIVFNGTTQYANLQVAANLMAQNSAGLGVYVTSQASNTPAAYIGSTVSAAGFFSINVSTASSGTISYAVNRSSSSNIASQPNRDQFLYASRTSSALSTYYRNSTSLSTSSTTSTAPHTNNSFLGAYSLNANPNQYAACTISFWIFTDGLNGTEEGSLYTITNTMLNAL